ncbi:permease [Leucobacter sp. OH2974_COT-288]|nr:permease [Leucobacter sp. OH2974_COT-288]
MSISTAPHPQPASATNRWFAVAAITAALTVLTLLTTLLPQDLVPWQARDAGTLALGVFIESFPFVVLGTVVAVAVQFWVPQHLLLRILPRSAWLRRGVLSLLGFLLPVCECGNVPLARGLLRRGFAPAEAITFVLAAPLLNPVTIITTYQAFGFQDGILIARIVGGFAVANFIGWLFSRLPQHAPVLAPQLQNALAHEHGDACNSAANSTACCDNNAHKASPTGTGTATADSMATQPPLRPGNRSKLQDVSAAFTAELLLLMPALALGSLLAGLIQTATPRELFYALGTHPLYSVLVLLVLAAIVSICSTVDAFFMLSFSSVFTPGAIATFLVFGALIDIKMLLLLRTTFTGRALALITIAAALCCIALGLGVNLLV